MISLKGSVTVRFEETTNASLYFIIFYIHIHDIHDLKLNKKTMYVHITIVYHALHVLLASTNAPRDRSRALSRQLYL